MQLNKNNFSEHMKPELKSHIEKLSLLQELALEYPNKDYFLLRKIILDGDYSREDLRKMLCQQVNLRGLKLVQ